MSTNDQSRKQTVFKEEKEENNQSELKENKTSSGLEQNIAGLFCYLCWFITGIIFFVIEKENRFVRFHAMQSIITSIVIIVISLLLTLIPFIGWIISLLIMPLMFVLWIIMMYKAYKGEWFKLPIVGDISEQQIDKLAN